MPNADPKLRRPWFDVSFIMLTLIGIGVILFLYVYYPKLIVPFSIAGIVLYLGFGIPRWQGSKIRKERARKAKIDEKGKWGFHSRDREGPWLNYIDYPLVKETDCANGKCFYSEWLVIQDGYIMVNPGKPSVDPDKTTVKYDFTNQRAYVWDGCTPKRWFFWLALIGTPDWLQKNEGIKAVTRKTDNKSKKKETKVKSDVDYEISDKTVFWQQALHASLIHDVLYQYLDSIPISKRNVDKLFCEMLKESSILWIVAKVYHFGVKYFGAWDIGEDDPKRNSDFNVIDFPNI